MIEAWPHRHEVRFRSQRINGEIGQQVNDDQCKKKLLMIDGLISSAAYHEKGLVAATKRFGSWLNV